MYSDKSGCILIKSIVLGQSCGNRAKVVVFGQEWMYSCKVVVILQTGCVRAKVVVIGQKWLYSGKIVNLGKDRLFRQNGCIRAK